MFKSIIKFARLRVTIMLFALAFLGGASVGEINLKTTTSILAIVFWYIHATSANDYADREIDEINLRGADDRPLVSKNISLKQLWIIHIGSGIVTLFLAFLYGTGAVILTIFMFIIDYIYSLKPFRIANRGIISQFLLSIAYVYYPFSLGYWSIESSHPYPWLLSFGLYLAFVARLLLKDFRDVKGDKQHGKKTFLLRHGNKITCMVSGFFWFLAMIFIGLYSSFSLGILIPLMLGFLQVFTLLKILARTFDSNMQQALIAFIAKSANALIITLLSFLLSKHQNGLSPFEVQFIPAAIGIVLLIFNWLRYINFTVYNINAKPDR